MEKDEDILTGFIDGVANVLAEKAKDNVIELDEVIEELREFELKDTKDETPKEAAVTAARILKNSIKYNGKDLLLIAAKSLLVILAKDFSDKAKYDIYYVLKVHIDLCNGDKYVNSEIEMKPLILDNDMFSKGYNTYQAVRYLTRFVSGSGEKIGNLVDILKCLHYICFEIKRINNEKSNNNI